MSLASLVISLSNQARICMPAITNKASLLFSFYRLFFSQVIHDDMIPLSVVWHHSQGSAHPDKGYPAYVGIFCRILGKSNLHPLPFRVAA